jgi:internalin A
VSIRKYTDPAQFFAAAEGITEAEVDFEWTLAVQQRQHLKRLRNLSLLSFGPSSRIETCESIDEIPSLTSVWLIGQHRLKDFSALARLSRLTELKVTAAWQLDLKPLRKMVNLKSLLLDGPESGYDAINSLTNLTDLHVYSIKIKNLKCISKLHCLEKLEVRAVPIITLEGLPNQAPLEHLDVSQTLISSVEQAASLTHLRVLRMAKCENIKEIEPTVSMRNLEEIYLNDIPNELDLSPLTKCPNLGVLFFYGTRVTSESFRAFWEMKRLRHCEFSLMQRGYPFSIQEIQSFAPNCKFRIVLPDGEIYSTPA